MIKTIFLTPLLILVEILIFNIIVDLVRQPSDIAVLVGVALICAYLAGNYYLVNYFINKLKNK